MEEKMMYIKVNKQNFGEVLEILEKQFEECDYVIFDLEFGGLKLRKGQADKKFDDYQIRHLKKLLTAKSFPVFQIGFTLFFKENKEITYEFDLMKDNLKSNEITFMDLQAIKYLRRNGFDFNRIIDNGIPYMNPSELKEIVEEREIQMKQQINDPVYHKIYVTIDECIEKEMKEFVVTPNNDYVMKCIFQKYGKQVNCYINDYIIVKTRDEHGGKALKFVKCQDQHKDVLKREFEKMLGFTKVIQLISERKIPIVGFNCMLDLYYIYQKFIADVPPTFPEFQKVLMENFQKIYDVGHIMRERTVATCFQKRRVSSLESVYEFLVEKKFVKEIKSTGFHNAGFDSQVTGYVFRWCCSKFVEGPVPFNVMFNYRGKPIYLDKPEPKREIRNMFIVERKRDLNVYRKIFSHYGIPYEQIIDENFCYYQVSVVDAFSLPKPWNEIVSEVTSDEDIHKWEEGKKLLIDYMKTFTNLFNC